MSWRRAPAARRTGRPRPAASPRQARGPRSVREHARARTVGPGDLFGTPERVMARRIGRAPRRPQQPHAPGRRARSRRARPRRARDRGVVDEHDDVRERDQVVREPGGVGAHRAARSAATSTTGSRRSPRTNASSSAARVASTWCGTDRTSQPPSTHSHRVDELADEVGRAGVVGRMPAPSGRATPAARGSGRARRPPPW